MNPDDRRWTPVDIALVVLAGFLLLNLLLYPLALVHATMLVGGETVGGSWPGVAQPKGTPPDPVIWAATAMLLLSAVSVTLAHGFQQDRRTVPMLLAFGATTLFALGFIGAQLSRALAYAGFADSLESGMLLTALGEHAVSLIAGMAMLLAAAVLALVRRHRGVTPAGEAAIWLWHAVDSVWLVLIVFAFSHNIMQVL